MEIEKKKKNVLRDFPWILSRAESEFAKEEEDSDSKVLEGTEAVGVGLYRLDAFSDCIGEPLVMIVKQIKQVTLEHPGRSDHRLEAAAHCTGIRSSKKLKAVRALALSQKWRNCSLSVKRDRLRDPY